MGSGSHHTREPAAADGETGRINAPASQCWESATRVELLELLEHCASALTAAGAELWDMRRDLAIACNQRSARCRMALKELLS